MFKAEPEPKHNELEISPIVTRSVSRKCSSVGALHNKVDWDEQMKIRKQWPVEIAYTIGSPIVQNHVLRDLLSRSLTHVMSFCKNIWSTRTVQVQTETFSEEFADSYEYYKLVPSSLTQEQEDVFGNDDDQLFFYLSDDFPVEQVLMSLEKNEEEPPLYIKKENGGLKPAILCSNQTYNTSSLCCSEESSYSDESITDNGAVLGLYNDHNYAQVFESPYSKGHLLNLEYGNKGDDEEFKLENALKSLLLNTAILKCLVCGQSPQEMMAFLDQAQDFTF